MVDDNSDLFWLAGQDLLHEYLTGWTRKWSGVANQTLGFIGRPESILAPRRQKEGERTEAMGTTVGVCPDG